MFTSGVLRSDLGLKAYQQSTSQLPHPGSEGAEGDKIKMPFSTLRGQWPEENFFSQMKTSSIEEVLNQQIDRVYVSTSRETRKKGTQGSRETIILL